MLLSTGVLRHVTQKKREEKRKFRIKSLTFLLKGVIIITRLESFRNNAARETTNTHFLSFS